MRGTIVWVGRAYEHLYAILSDGRTYRLDKTDGTRHWTLVASLPLDELP